MNLQPLNDMLIVKRLIASEYKTASGLILPPVEESSDTPYQGVVLAAGPGKPCKLQPAAQEVIAALTDLVSSSRAIDSGHGIGHSMAISCIERAEEALKHHHESVYRIPMQVKVGDIVIFSKNLFQEFKIDGVLVVAFGQDSVLGILDKTI